MSSIWTLRRIPLPPSDSDRRFALLSATAALILVLLIPGCHGTDEQENRIKPIVADLQIANPYSGSPDPAVFMDEASTSGDFGTVQVKLRAGTAPIEFASFTLELTYNFNLIQIGDVFEVNPGVFGSCSAGTACDPFCFTNAAQANQGLTAGPDGKAHFLMGVSARPGCPVAKTGQCKAIAPMTCTSDLDCPKDSCETATMQCRAAGTSCTDDTDCQSIGETCDTGMQACISTKSPCTVDSECIIGETCTPVADTTLVTVAFIAQTAIPDPLPGDPTQAQGRIALISGPGRGDCEILDRFTNEVLVGGQPIACEDGIVYLTAAR